MDQIVPRAQRQTLNSVEEISQTDCLAALGLGRAFGDPDADVTRIDTHCSAVFLVGDRAYKLKRAIKTAYLDYSTLELRHRACVREVMLNRRTAPALYLGVAPLTLDPQHGLMVEGEGPTVDWLVVMKRFDPALGFDHLAARGDLTPAMVIDATDQALALHATARRMGDGDNHGGGAFGFAANMFDTIEELKTAKGCVTIPQLGRLGVSLSAHMTHYAERLNRRLDEGKVLQGHGDLHLGNIALVDGRPTLFDCIEFDDRIGAIDQGYDFAFLWMDLDRLGLRDLAWASFHRYLEQTGDYEIAHLLPLFLSTRALVRAKTGAAAAKLEGELAAITHERDRAHAYADAAEHYLDPERPQLIAVGGLSGTGKSTAARAIAPDIGVTPGAVVLRTDCIRKQMFDTSPDLPLPQSAYTAAVTRKVYERMGLIAEGLLDAGHSVILDAVFARPAERNAVEQIAARGGADFSGLWLTAPLDVRLERVCGRSGDASDADASIVREQDLYRIGALDWTQIDATGGQCDTASRMADALAENGRKRLNAAHAATE